MELEVRTDLFGALTSLGRDEDDDFATNGRLVSDWSDREPNQPAADAFCLDYYPYYQHRRIAVADDVAAFDYYNNSFFNRLRWQPFCYNVEGDGVNGYELFGAGQFQFWNGIADNSASADTNSLSSGSESGSVVGPSMASPPQAPESTSYQKIRPTVRRFPRTQVECAFCKNNKETEKVYRGHILKDLDGRTVCPVLCKYVCPVCHQTGEKAHTLRYCPENKMGRVPSVMSMLKNGRKADGKRRRN